MEENMEKQEEKVYVPRPMWQVWAARVGLVIVLVGIALYLYQIANGGL